MTVEITKPGVYDIPADVYHADPVPGGSLSSTAARRLLDMPPARWRYEQEHPPAPTPAMLLGTAVHSLVLGVGAKVVRIDADDWRTKPARQARATAEAAGDVALLRDDYERAEAMADAVMAHPIAGRLFDPARGRAEQTMVWRDDECKIWCRAMVDHLPHPDGTVRPILVDLKTCADAQAVSRSVARYGYHQQAAWYLDGYQALHPDSDPAFLFVFVESAPPYLVRVVELDQPSLLTGQARNRRALEIYRDCREIDHWPGYPPEVDLVSLPGWALHQTEETF